MNNWKMSESEIKNSNYSQFQKIALLAYAYLKNKKSNYPEDAWNKACFCMGVKESIADKHCSFVAFVALCKFGFLYELHYRYENGNSKCASPNAIYAKWLVRLYKNGKITKKMKMSEKWEIMRSAIKFSGEISEPAKTNNGQLNVVEVFYMENLLNFENVD